MVMHGLPGLARVSDLGEAFVMVDLLSVPFLGGAIRFPHADIESTKITNT